jgi:four helix bundle protein
MFAIWLSDIGYRPIVLTNTQPTPSMPSYQRFEDLPVWQEAARLYNLVLDLLDEHGALLSPGLRNQLDRAALSISNNIAEGFERVTTNELLAFLAIARGSAGEVRSMIAVVKDRPRFKRLVTQFQQVREAAESCSRQLTAWARSVESSPVQGKRHLTPATRAARNAVLADGDFRRRFLLSLAPEHPLYSSPEAVTARQGK